MEPYKNSGGDSGVSAYEIGKDFIRVLFAKGGKIYRYTYVKPGEEDVERMKALAIAGEGLNEYINRYVRDRYEDWEPADH